MSEIIKKPHYEMRCHICGCHFKFELKDITSERFGAYKEYETEDFVRCPNCQNGIQVRDNHKTLLPEVKVRY